MAHKKQPGHLRPYQNKKYPTMTFLTVWKENYRVGGHICKPYIQARKQEYEESIIYQGIPIKTRQNMRTDSKEETQMINSHENIFQVINL